MSAKVTDRDAGAAELKKRLASMNAGRVRVGILSDEAKREEKPAARGKHSKKARVRAKVEKRAEGRRELSLLEVAVVHEFGAGHVPARSFIRATIDERRGDIAKLQLAVAKQVLAGRITAQQGLAQIGAKVASWMQARIVAGIAPPLSARTLKRKGKKTTPLILTGQLRGSISFAVEGA